MIVMQNVTWLVDLFNTVNALSLVTMESLNIFKQFSCIAMFTMVSNIEIDNS